MSDIVEKCLELGLFVSFKIHTEFLENDIIFYFPENELC